MINIGLLLNIGPEHDDSQSPNHEVIQISIQHSRSQQSVVVKLFDKKIGIVFAHFE